MRSKERFSLQFMTFFITVTCFLSGCTEGPELNDEVRVKSAEIEITNDLIICDGIINPSENVTSEEVEMLKFVREEEKLAHDVYDTLSRLYPLPIFKNITKSEWIHMEKVLCLLIHYDIEDPASDKLGEFTNPDLQDKFDEFLIQGSICIKEALDVGATIEDMDIYDLNLFIPETENEAIVTIFEFLVCGSGNHLRSFTALLDKRDVVYEPEFISLELYNEILLLPQQFCSIAQLNQEIDY